MQNFFTQYMRFLLFIFLPICLLSVSLFLYAEIHTRTASDRDHIKITIEEGESARALSERLEQENIIRSARLFRWYLRFKNLDTEIQHGKIVVEKPITLVRVVEAMTRAETNEKEMTIIPGWNLRDVVPYLSGEGFGSEEELFRLLGYPAKKNKPNFVFSDSLPLLQSKPADVSFEGYLAPETMRVFSNASAEDVIKKLIQERDRQFSDEWRQEILRQGKTIHEILTMASILEREVRTPEDRAKVADIFWRRLDLGWALQADSTVHYAVGTSGDVFTSAEDRASKNLWNTYEYPGLPPGPISIPSIESIEAAIFPKKNEFWYFLTTLEGEVKYAKTLEEHTQNRQKYFQ